ncbi:hypothetical protein cyc_00514 [Cyclospora cayetanensis]|uniref:Uncharacterized protein n=1 Tax=Cyclospora cayetanensis TaxID=88456 RepID=A0A1D3D8P7_9EIME|nr:hypothetical protein cyc_00514 [Cyclospora cayetanensis]
MPAASRLLSILRGDGAFVAADGVAMLRQAGAECNSTRHCAESAAGAVAGKACVNWGARVSVCSLVSLLEDLLPVQQRRLQLRMTGHGLEIPHPEALRQAWPEAGGIRQGLSVFAEGKADAKEYPNKKQKRPCAKHYRILVLAEHQAGEKLSRRLRAKGAADTFAVSGDTASGSTTDP